MKKVIKALKVGGATLASMVTAAQLAIVRADIGQGIGLVSNTTINPGTGYASDFGKLINFVLRIVLIVGVLLVLLYLVLGGIEYITSGGEKGKTEEARNKITSAIIGLIILAASYAILTLVLHFLGLGDLNNALQSVGTINQPGPGSGQ